MNSKLLSLALFFFAGSTIFSATGCSTAPQTSEGKDRMEQSARNVVADAENDDPSLAALLHSSVGYAVFPSVGKGGFGAGGAYGKGTLFEGGEIVGFCDLSQVSIGFQFGGQAYTEILVFKTADAIDTFKHGDFAFDAQATAVAIESGAGSNAKFAHGVAVFTMREKGLMFEAAIGGQRFTYETRSNAQ